MVGLYPASKTGNWWKAREKSRGPSHECCIALYLIGQNYDLSCDTVLHEIFANQDKAWK